MYALGVLLFKLLVNDYPFKKAEPEEYRVVQDFNAFWAKFPQAQESLSEQTRHFVWRLLASSPAQRIETFKHRMPFLSSLHGSDSAKVHDEI